MLRKPLHGPFSSSKRLMRILRALVKPTTDGLGDVFSVATTIGDVVAFKIGPPLDVDHRLDPGGAMALLERALDVVASPCVGERLNFAGSGRLEST
jgi:hypothetical protein